MNGQEISHTALTVYEEHYKTIIMQCDGWEPRSDSHKCV